MITMTTTSGYSPEFRSYYVRLSLDTRLSALHGLLASGYRLFAPFAAVMIKRR